MKSVLLPIIKPGLLDEFLGVWKSWFVTEDSVEDEKEPGKLKSTECSFNVNLTPRCLLCQNRHDRHLGIKFAFFKGLIFL